MTRNSFRGRQIPREPPCVTQGMGDRPGGISSPENPLAKFAQQELPYPQGHCLVARHLHASLKAGWSCAPRHAHSSVAMWQCGAVRCGMLRARQPCRC